MTIILVVIAIYILIGTFVLSQVIAEDGDYSLFGYPINGRWNVDEYLIAAGYTFTWPLLMLGLIAKKMSKHSKKNTNKEKDYDKG